MFNRKAKKIKLLEVALRYRDEELRRAGLRITELEKANEWIREVNAELEKTNVGELDVNTLMCAVLDYHNILARNFFPDPILDRADVAFIFDKYRVNRPK